MGRGCQMLGWVRSHWRTTVRGSRAASGPPTFGVWCGMVYMVLWGLLRNLHSRPRGPALPPSTEPASFTSTNAPASGVPTVLFPHWALSLLEVLSCLSTELHALGAVSVRGTELPLQPPCLPGLLSVLGALVGSLQTGASFHTCSLAADLAPRPLRLPGPGKTTTPWGLWDVHRSPV